MKLVAAFDELLQTFQPHFKSAETFERARAMAFSSIVTYGRHTISRLISSKNAQQRDWSADYKFFSLRPWEAPPLFFEILNASDPHAAWPDRLVLTSLDASVKKKSGKKIPGVTTQRDPLSPPYHVNLMSGLRYLQASVVIAPDEDLAYHRAIPIYFAEAPPVKKPPKNAAKEVKEHYQKAIRIKNLSIQGHQAALHLRDQVNRLTDGSNRLLVITVDGGFCNRNFLRSLPDSIVAIARTRKDLKLFAPATGPSRPGKGRNRLYGERLPTPEEIRRDEATYPWQTARIFGAGKYHLVRYKTLGPVLWPKGTGRQPLRLIIIAPLGYRKSKKSRLLYRNPAYLLVPMVDIAVEHLIQFYFLHWDIEVNHRDEKTLLGLYDAQVRSDNSVVRNPQFTAAVYSLLFLASLRAYGARRTKDYLPEPKWRQKIDRRPSTLDIIGQFRREVLIAQLERDLELDPQPQTKKKRNRKRPRSRIEAKKRGFVRDDKEQRSTLKLPVNIIAAMLYADA